MGELIRLAPRVPTAQERLRNVNGRLIGATLRWKGYRSRNGTWLPGRCELCHAPFVEGGARGALHSGYAVVRCGPAGQEDCLWICVICFEGRRSWFDWIVEGTPHDSAEGTL
jgi:hypothetical protein